VANRQRISGTNYELLRYPLDSYRPALLAAACCDRIGRSDISSPVGGPPMKNNSAKLLGAATIAAGLVLGPQISRADESGISFWLPGLYGSLSATPTTPGWSIAAIYYHTTVSASGAAAAAREIQVGRFPATVNTSLNLNLNAHADLILIAPTYTVAEPVLGGQLSLTVAGIYGRSAASLAGTLTTAVGPIVSTRTGFLEDALTSYGDLPSS
jgi:hypothetical protein